ncbi:MAG TPA: sigma 54-interacting transcriptional regulator [Candidatus Polarisedimenticolaceae bacterium]|nr:sigma 54-interacting transcriptional regulator [Candidatus Polarisedimenticolaceae bacterium]
MLVDKVAGRYTLLEEIGRGGMGVVHRAREDGRAAPIALKVLSTREYSESALRHFEQEFRTLTELSHPNLTEVYDFGRAPLGPGGRVVPYFTMELVEGESLDRAVARGLLDEATVVAYLAQTGQALAYLHARGLVHRDVKPSNLIVASAGGGRVKLMDLGLAARPEDAGARGMIRGTVAYLSPEAARGDPVDPRADLYSLGCVAYELLTGRPPFQSASALGVLRGHIQEEPLPPSSLNRAISPPMEALILRLLAKDPGLRPSSADRFLHMLNAAAGGRLDVATAEHRRHRVLGAGFAGRGAELSQLNARMDEVARGAGRVVFLSGEAGIGKSRLLRAFQIRCQIEGHDVFVGRAGSDDGPGSGLAEAIGRALRASAPLEPALLARHGAALAGFLGPGGGIPVAEDAEPAPGGADDRFRVAAAVEAALAALAASRPLVLAVDDLQHADEATCLVLRHLVRVLSQPRSPRVLLLAAYRGDEVTRQTPVFDLLAEGREDGGIEEIAVGALGVDDIRAMLRAMLGVEEVPAPFVARAVEETRGNPLHLFELVALLAEEGHVAPGSDAPLDPEILSRVEIPHRILALAERRLSRIEGDARRLLEAAAVLGAARLDADVLAGVTGLRWEAVVRALRDLEEAFLIERAQDESGAPVDRIAHPSLFGLALEALPPDSRRELHARALTYLERRGRPRRHAAWAALAGHAEAAGQPGRAIEAFERAGDLAREAGALRESADLYGRAVDLLLRQGEGAAAVLCAVYEKRSEVWGLAGQLGPAEDDARWMLARAEKAGQDALRTRAHLALGDALLARGQVAEAQEAYEVALAIAERTSASVLAAAAETGLGRAAGHLGNFDEGGAHLARAIAEARKAVRPDLEVAALLALGALRREQGSYKASLAAFQEARARSDSRTLGRVEHDILEGEALAHEVEGRLREALEACERARERAESRGDVLGVAGLTARAGLIALRQGDFDGARARFDAALATHRRLGAREGIVQVSSALALLQIQQARYDEAAETADEALRQARRTARRDLVASALDLIGVIHTKVGDYDRAGAALEEAQRIMRDARNLRWLSVFLVDLAEWRRLSGDAEGARKHLQEAAFLARRIGDRRLESVALCRLGEAHLDEKDADRALVACRKALGLVERSGLPREEAEARLLRARVELSRPGGDVVRAEIDALESAKTFRELRDPDALWLAEHVAGRAAMRLGRRDEAVERIGRAFRYLDGVRSRLAVRWRESFLSDPRRREVFDDHERLRASAPKEAAEAEAAPSARQGEAARARAEVRALRRMLEINRTLNATRDPDRLLHAILDAALEVTGAERGFLLLSDGEEVATASSRGAEGTALEEDARALSRSIARRTIERGEPILATDAEADDRFRGAASVHDLRIRSVLCVPLKIQSEVVGAVYLDSRLDRGVFGPPHLEHASLLAEQAAIALDTARMLQRIEEQKARLDRVNQELERTAAAQRDALADAREILVSTRSSLELRFRFEELVGGSPSMQRVYHVVERLAPKKLPVLVAGESGTGKELVARALHAKSDRAGGPFFTVNCAALPEALLESELFGFRKGAFTGATRNKPGYFELAHGGTLFLDEIGEMGPSMQAKLLRVLQDGQVMPVGGEATVQVDVRIVSATNRDLRAMIGEGKFREDLYYRIHVARIDLPPLRERLEDIPLLVDHFLEAIAAEEGGAKREVDPAVFTRLAAHPWPGNVRELQHHVQRIAAFTRGSTFTLRDVERYGDLRPAAPASAPLAASPPSGEVDSLEELERKQIKVALEAAGGNKTRAAEILGINRVTLFRKLKRLALED